MKRAMLCSWLTLMLLLGCGAKSEEAYYASDKSAEAPMGEAGEIDNAAAEQAIDENAAAQSAKRKIIYEGRISVMVSEFPDVKDKIPALVDEYKGYVASSETDRYGRRRSARWVVRIPANRFSDFLKEVSELGITQSQSQTADDVTMEYLDVEARLEAKKKLEKRIEQVLEEHEGKLSDQLEGERELNRVRSEIESLEGRLRYLTNRTDFSTVTIDITEGNPAFAGRVGEAWQQSLWSLKVSAQNFLIGLVAFIPWIPLNAIFAWVAWILWKRFRKPREKTPAS